MKTGCCGNSRNYDQIRSMGYDYAELSGAELMSLSEEDFRAFAAHVKEAGFPVLGINAYCSGEHPLVGPGFSEAGTADYAKELCRRAAELGVRTIGVGAPAARRLPPGYSAKTADSQMKTALRLIAAEAAPYGITVLLEALHSGLCEYLNHTEEAAELVKELALPNLWLVYDYYHAALMGEDFASMHRVMPLVRHLHYSTELGDGRRGYVTEEAFPEFSLYVDEALEDGYGGNISVEADESLLLRDGPLCAELMKKAAEE
ncbi:MAG: sugar phosphate isomerase/epimerase [Oscillospiraceae bacterium]|nr:sugar phosphate isomerase/epimerase [Oscillospiraceae bacterium]